MAQNDRRGGSAKQARPMTNNEEMSLIDKLKTVLKALNARKDEIEAVLPPDLPFDRFHATVNQALRNNPDLFRGTVVSIINACVKAAYDGLRLDGREAALVLHSFRIAQNPDRYEDQAQYFPMVFGIVQQILRGGEVIAIDVDVIRANDQYQVIRGTDPKIVHVPELLKDRGAIITAYSVATLKSGAKTFQIMTKAEIDDVRKEAKTAFVWNRWEGEMSKKSVVRRHRKMLPLGDRDIVDIEAADIYPQFQPQNALPDRTAPSRPTRGAPAIEHQPGSEGIPLDFGDQELERDGELIEGNQQRHSAGTGQKMGAVGGDLKGDGKGKPLPSVDDELPEDDNAWASWSTDVEKRILAAENAPAVRAVESAEKARIDAATQDRRDFIKFLITDRLADLASEATAEQGDGSED